MNDYSTALIGSCVLEIPPDLGVRPVPAIMSVKQTELEVRNATIDVIYRKRLVLCVGY